MKNKQFVIKSFSNDIDTSTDIIETELPSLKANEVLLKNKFVGINALYDRELYKGNVPYIQVEFPYTFGVESVGTIVDVGSAVSRDKIGKHLGRVKVGTAYQEYQILKQTELIEIPEATREYLTIYPTGVSADLALEMTAEIKSGETVVVDAAAGGLGHILVQLCKLKNCHVVAICGGPEKKAFLESLNCCQRIIDYKNETVEKILDVEYKNKINVGIDSVGRHMFDAMLNNLSPLGKLVVIGLASELSNDSFEKRNQTRVYESIYWKGASVRCFMNHLFKDKHEDSRLKLQKLYQDKLLDVRVDKTSFNGIESIKDASKYLLSGQSCGKVLVKL